MASDPDRYLGRDVFSYTQEKERFQKDLFQFHAGRGTQFISLPTVTGKPVDLYLLYSLVTKNGGFHKVCDRNLWWKLPTAFFHFPEACANSELALKQLYMRYLYLYERVNIHGDDPDHPEDEDTGPRGAKSGRILVHQVPMRYNYRQHNVRCSDRPYYHLSTDLAKPNDYERLEKSLLSGLANEVDFAINVCCILSIEGPSALKLSAHHHLLNLLLAHVGLFTDDSTLQLVYHNEWFPKTNRNFAQFWYESLDHTDLGYSNILIDMISFLDNGVEEQRRLPAGCQVLHLGKDDRDPVFYRVKQVSHVLRNLSFDAANSRAMAESVLVFNFAMLCCHSNQMELKRNGMDILENISKLYVIAPIHESSTQLVFQCLHKWLNSQDKLELVGGLLVTAALSQVEQNEERLLECLTQDIYCQIVSLARICDLQLIVSALDALYHLSEIGEATCECISLVKHCIDFLANLVTVETQSFGESALGGIIVRDNRLPPNAHPTNTPQAGQLSRPVGTMMGPPAAPYNSRPIPRPQTTAAQSAIQQQQQQPGYTSSPTPPMAVPTMGISQRPQASARDMVSKCGLAPSHKPILPATPQNLASMSPEQVSCNWLRANYEPYPGSLVITAKVHQEYVLWLQRRGGNGAMPVPPATFVSCVRKVFTYSELVVTGPESQISGVRWKVSHPNASNQAAQSNKMRPVLTQPPPPYGSPHLISPGSPVTSVPPRISSPSAHTGSDMLRSMLTSDDTGSRSRPRSNSGTGSTVSSGRPVHMSRGGRRNTGSRSASPRTMLSSDSPLPPISPASSMELQVCGSPEKVDSVDHGASLARIERVENTQSSLSTNTNCITSSSEKTSPNNLSKNTNSQHNGDMTIGKSDLKLNDLHPPSKMRKEEGDSAMVTCDGSAPSAHDSSKSNGLKLNGTMTPCDILNSASVRNGHSSDSDSLLTEPKTCDSSRQSETKSKTAVTCMMNGGGDADKPITSRNGYLNGLEKMIANIHPDKSRTALPVPRQLDHRRHHSGDSIASQSSTSTQLSLSQQSVSSESRHDTLEQASNHLPAQAQLSNQQTAQTSTTNQIPSLPPQSDRLSAQPLTNELPTEISLANNIPTVVDSISNRGSDTPPAKPPTRKSSAGISVVTDTEGSTMSPLVSPVTSGRKPGRKRRRSTASSTDSKQSTDSSVGQHKCLWESCGQGFSSCAMLRKHASKAHTSTAGACMWAGCDRVERKRWALVSHVNDRHTSDIALAKALANREKGIVPVATGAPPQSPSIYTPQAAKIAILRNYPKPPYPEFADSREGPVTKHIRFTAALILRNICRYSPTGRT